MKECKGGVCAALGFKANGIYSGIRKNKEKKDLALIVSDTLASAACVYTTNLVKGAPIAITKKNVSDGYAQAFICNSGNANTCNDNGEYIASETCKLVEKHTGIKANNVIVASTGVIGQKLSLEPFVNGMQSLVDGLGNNSYEAESAIMTTDTIVKEIAYEFIIDDKVCHIGGIAKGSGMIHPNMATMLCFITSDVNISPEMLQKALSDDIIDTFNMVSVDGDTSTNDMVSILANGLAGNEKIEIKSSNYIKFKKALNKVTTALSRMIAKDGEGASKLLECAVSNAKSKKIARMVAKSVICSSLLKAAMFGADANWGRVLCAIGYSGAVLDINKIDVSFKSKKGTIDVCKNGAGIEFSEEIAKEILLEKDIIILVNLNSGKAKSTAYGCDLTYDYVKINGDYRS